MAITYSEEKNYDESLVWIERAAEYCTPVQFHRYISDSDFKELRQLPSFRAMVRELYPMLPNMSEN